ncbi:MAG: ABC transporter substrate-binding protein [Deltaproteobacteria bacterium]|nr:ABC transporter substrate-binding protein [Deltaproteobacteria bacterium]
MRHRIIPAFFACIFALTLLAAPYVLGSGSLPDGTVRIGVIAPLTGPFASGGSSFMKSLSIAAKRANEETGPSGRRVVLVQGDSEGLVSRARNEALRLIEREKVHFLIGAYLSEETMGVIEVAAKYRIVLMVPISATDEITDLVKKDPRRYRYIFRTGYSIARWASMIGEFVAARGCSRYAFIGSRIRWNRELRRSLKKYLEEKNITEVIADFYSPKQPVIKPLARKVKDAAPGIIIAGDPGINAIEVIKSLEMIEFGGPVLSVGGTLADARVVAELRPNFPLFALASFFPGSSDRGTVYFDRFEKTYGYTPSGYSDTLPGDALSILMEAVSRAGVLEGERVADELERGRFPGAAGIYSFDSFHQATWGSHELPGVIIRWNKTAFELIHPEK